MSNEKGCGHVTLKRQDQPCPHPKCSSGSVYVEAVLTPPQLFVSVEPETLLPLRHYERRDFVLNNERFWAWKERT